MRCLYFCRNNEYCENTVICANVYVLQHVSVSPPQIHVQFRFMERPHEQSIHHIREQYPVIGANYLGSLYLYHPNKMKHDQGNRIHTDRVTSLCIRQTGQSCNVSEGDSLQNNSLAILFINQDLQQPRNFSKSSFEGRSPGAYSGSDFLNL